MKDWVQLKSVLNNKNMGEINQNQNLTAALEAILFAYGEPMDTRKIFNIFARRRQTQIDTQTDAEEITEEEVKKAIEELQKNLENEGRGLRLIFQGDKVQLATKPEFSGFLEEFIKEEFKENLTPASLETLALIVYLGPITRAKIDYFRGVNSSFILRSLMIRGLIERIEGSYLYQASFDLLKNLGVSKINELPDYDKFREMINIKLEAIEHKE